MSSGDFTLECVAVGADLSPCRDSQMDGSSNWIKGGRLVKGEVFPCDGTLTLGTEHLRRLGLMCVWGSRVTERCQLWSLPIVVLHPHPLHPSYLLLSSATPLSLLLFFLSPGLGFSGPDHLLSKQEKKSFGQWSP